MLFMNEMLSEPIRINIYNLFIKLNHGKLANFANIHKFTYDH